MEKYGMAMAAMEAFGRPLVEDNESKKNQNDIIKEPKKGGMMMACRHLVSDIIASVTEEDHKDTP